MYFTILYQQVMMQYVVHVFLSVSKGKSQSRITHTDVITFTLITRGVVNLYVL